jgi:glycosyltransferase involved in cell wall biosynthesis
MNNNPLVSVILPVKNGERFLRAAIESVLAQDYRPLELIVIDGKSRDTTASIAKSFEEVKYVLQKGEGVANAWNLGIKMSRGEYIAFQAHDDRWVPDKLIKQISYLKDNPKMGYVIAKVKFILEPGEKIPPGFRAELLEGEHIGRTIENMVARKSLFDRIGLFSESLAVGNDVEWFVRAKDRKVKMDSIPEVLLYKRVHDANVTFVANPQEGNRALLQIMHQSIHQGRKRKDE